MKQALVAGPPLLLPLPPPPRRLDDVMCVFTFSTQKMLSEAKIENVPFVSIKQTVETSSRKSVKSSVTMSRSNVFVLGWLASVAYPKK